MLQNYFMSAWRNLQRKLIAAPETYIFMHNWLLHYHHRNQLSWWIFRGAGAGALTITQLTLSYQSIGAALANPVNALRTQ